MPIESSRIKSNSALFYLYLIHVLVNLEDAFPQLVHQITSRKHFNRVQDGLQVRIIERTTRGGPLDDMFPLHIHRYL